MLNLRWVVLNLSRDSAEPQVGSAEPQECSAEPQWGWGWGWGWGHRMWRKKCHFWLNVANHLPHFPNCGGGT